MVAEKSFSWDSTTQQSHLSYQHAATLVVAVIGFSKSEHSVACIVLQDLRHLLGLEESCHASAAEQNLCHLLRSVSWMSL